MIVMVVLVIFGQVDARALQQPASTSGVSAVASGKGLAPGNVFATFAAKLKTVDAMHRSMRMCALSHWQFATIRSRYGSLLSSVSGDHAAEEMVRAGSRCRARRAVRGGCAND